jgi:uncharacterized protein (UPF0276 family)
VLIENPALYLEFAPLGDGMDEVDFLDELSRRSGCGLLLDIGNVLVSAHNCARDASDYLARFPILIASARFIWPAIRARR